MFPHPTEETMEKPMHNERSTLGTGGVDEQRPLGSWVTSDPETQDSAKVSNY